MEFEKETDLWLIFYCSFSQSCFSWLPSALSHSVSVWKVSKMNILYLVTGVISLALLVYLFAALLKPEWF